jgi:hypothetical protein
MKNVMLLGLLSFVLAGNSIGQTINEEQITSCEINNLHLNSAHQAAGDDWVIIAIARLGKNEKQRTLNKRRLYNVRAYLTGGWKRKLNTIVLAESERTDGFGKIEIYVAGMLSGILVIPTNKDLPLGSCEGDEGRKADMIYYPYLEEKTNKSEKSKRISTKRKSGKQS